MGVEEGIERKQLKESFWSSSRGGDFPIVVYEHEAAAKAGSWISLTALSQSSSRPSPPSRKRVRYVGPQKYGSASVDFRIRFYSKYT